MQRYNSQIQTVETFDYKQECDPDNKALDMLMNVIAKDFVNRFVDNSEGVYRNHKNNQTPIEKAYEDFMMDYDCSMQLTIILPDQNIYGYKHTKSFSKATGLYRTLVREIEMFFTHDKNNWFRHPLFFRGVMENGEEGFKHAHLSIQYNNLNLCFIYRLCWALQQVALKYHLSAEKVFDLVCIYDKKGHCAYVSKEIDDKKDKRKKKFQDEGCLPFDLKTWYKIGEKKSRQINFHPLYALKLYIRMAWWLKQRRMLCVSNPINKLKKLLVYHRKNRRKFEVDTTSNFYTFDGWKGIVHIPVI